VPTALVTGTSGYLGSRIAAHLATRGFRVLERRGRRETAELPAFSPGGPVDLIVHAGFTVDFSAVGPGAAGESESVANTRAVAAWGKAHGAPHLVFLSAAGILGVSATSRVRAEESVGETEASFEAYRATRYIQDKLACEGVLADYPGLATTLYLTTVYGPGMKGPARGALLGLRGLSPLAVVPPGGTSYLDLQDLLEGIDLVAARRPAGALILSSGNLTYRQLYAEAADVLGVAWRKRVMVLPMGSRGMVERAMAAWNGRGPAAAILASTFGFKYYSSERARRLLGFKPRRPLRATLEAALKD
jgi:nucleoside-diphosphate-sugar epimerase